MNNPTQDNRAIRTTTCLSAAVAPMTVCGPVGVLLPVHSHPEGALGESWRGSSLRFAHRFDPAA